MHSDFSTKEEHLSKCVPLWPIYRVYRRSRVYTNVILEGYTLALFSQEELTSLHLKMATPMYTGPCGCALF